MSEQENEYYKETIILKTRVEMLTENVNKMTEAFTRGIERLEAKLDYRDENFVTKQMLELELKQRDKEIETMKENKKESRTLWPVWLGLAITTVLGALALYK